MKSMRQEDRQCSHISTEVLITHWSTHIIVSVSAPKCGRPRAIMNSQIPIFGGHLSPLLQQAETCFGVLTTQIWSRYRSPGYGLCKFYCLLLLVRSITIACNCIGQFQRVPTFSMVQGQISHTTACPLLDLSLVCIITSHCTS